MFFINPVADFILNRCTSNSNSDHFTIPETVRGETVALHTFFVETNLEGPGSTHSELRVRRERGPPRPKTDSKCVGEVETSKRWDTADYDGTVGSTFADTFVLPNVDETAKTLGGSGGFGSLGLGLGLRGFMGLGFRA